MLVVRSLAVVAGALIVLSVLVSAARTVVVPRSEDPFITRALLWVTRSVFHLVAGRYHTIEARERALSRIVPLNLLVLPFLWASLIISGSALVYWGLGLEPFRDALVFSGSSFTTLGFAARPEDLAFMLLAIAQGILGLEIIALLISFLPSIYGHFTTRETLVTRLEALAGSPPDPVVVINRAHSIGLLPDMEAVWREWATWFAAMEESHTTFPFLVFFRSPEPIRSWVTASTCVLDAAALRLAAVRGPSDVSAPLMIRSGYLALRRVADQFPIAYNPNPRPDDAISISRAEFDLVLGEMDAEGVPLVADRDQAWRDYAGWRVNYDAVSLGLADLVLAPPSRWCEAAPIVNPG